MSWRERIVGPEAKWLALFAAALVTLPYAATGIFADDYYHQLLMDQAPGAPGTKWDLFTFATGDWKFLEPMVTNGPLPWWCLEEVRFIFLRPVSVALALFDHSVFGRNFVLAHLHSLLWYVALVAVVGALLRVSLRATAGVASLAVLLFAIDDAHVMIAGWLANRNAAVSCVFVLLGVLAHVRWREHGFKAGLPLSLVCVAVGLGAGEAALAAVTYFIAYELTAGPGDLRRRLTALLPLALLGVAYIAVYRWRGAGSFGSGIYLDPLRETGPFLFNALPRALALIGAQFLGSTADFWLALPKTRPALVLTGVAALWLMTVLLRRVWPRLSEDERRGLRWLTVGGALSLVPVLATFPLNRLLLMPSVAGAALVAAVLTHGWREQDDRVLRYGARLLFVTVPLMGVLAWPIGALLVRGITEHLARSSLEVDLEDEQLSGEVVVFVAPDPMASLYTPQVRTFFGKPAKSWLTFSFARYPHRLTRVSERVFELEIDGRMMESVFEQLVRAERFSLPLGFKRTLRGVTVEVIGLDEGLPNRLRLTFEEDPSSGRYTFAQWKDTRLVPFALPAVGTTHDFGLVASALAQ